MSRYTINSVSTIDGTTQEISKISSTEDMLDKSAQEDFLKNVISVLQSQKFTDIKVPIGDKNSRPYLFYDPTQFPIQPTVNSWKEFVQGESEIPELDQTRFDAIMNETFLIGKKFMLALNNSLSMKVNKKFQYKSKYGYSYDIIVNS